MRFLQAAAKYGRYDKLTMKTSDNYYKKINLYR
jgi:hypothetical protein